MTNTNSYHLPLSLEDVLAFIDECQDLGHLKAIVDRARARVYGIAEELDAQPARH